MKNSIIWKLIFTAVIMAWAVLSLFPIKDTDFRDYVLAHRSLREGARHQPSQVAVPAEGLPDQPGPADLQHRGEPEQQDGADAVVHGAAMLAGRSRFVQPPAGPLTGWRLGPARHRLSRWTP